MVMKDPLCPLCFLFWGVRDLERLLSLTGEVTLVSCLPDEGPPAAARTRLL